MANGSVPMFSVGYVKTSEILAISTPLSLPSKVTVPLVQAEWQLPHGSIFFFLSLLINISSPGATYSATRVAENAFATEVSFQPLTHISWQSV